MNDFTKKQNAQRRKRSYGSTPTELDNFGGSSSIQSTVLACAKALQKAPSILSDSSFKS